MSTSAPAPHTPEQDYVAPEVVRATMGAYGKKKANLPARDTLVRGFMSGMLLAFATSVAMEVIAEGSLPWVGAFIFPLGFVILILLGFELLTGNFALVPVALMDRTVSFSKMMANWGLVFVANLIGSLVYAVLFYAVMTKFGQVSAGPIGEVIAHKAESKTLAYQEVGTAAGVGTAFVKGILCNWMVATGTIMALVARSVIGKLICMWLPVFAFFAMGFEHSVVNMFLIPAGIMFGNDIGWGDWLVWNQITVTVGNAVGAFLLVALVMRVTYTRRAT
ncbi:MAG TPA: formate/nitrite transporter family protein [Miltoncostaeaceae bacterium]|nr:formate/nitrite transporter family protein [Miltoncostaeaceae bacterium]